MEISTPQVGISQVAISQPGICQISILQIRTFKNVMDKHPFADPNVETLAKNPGLKVYVTFTAYMTQLPSGEWAGVDAQEQLIWTDTFLPSTKLIRQS